MLSQLPAERGSNGRFVPTEAALQRQAEACRLRMRGLSYGAIAKELGYADASGARFAVQRALQVTVQEPADEVRTLELERLDSMFRLTLQVAEDMHPTVSAGKVLDVPDHTLRLAAVDRLLRIQERRARLLGLDAPQRVSVDAENLGREIGELLGALGVSGTHDNCDYHARDAGDDQVDREDG